MTDYDFTNDDGDGVEIDADPDYGILLSTSSGDAYAALHVTPAQAREIAKALNAAADETESK